MLIDIVLVYAVGRGGLEDVITKVHNGLVKQGHRVRVFQSYAPTEPEWEKTLTEIYYYGEKGSIEKESIPSLAAGYADALVKYGKPDVVIATHAPSLSLICRVAVSSIKGPNPPILSWLHGPPEYFGNEDLLKYSDAHLAISTQIGDSIRKYIYSDVPIYYIGNPVDFEDIVQVPRANNKLKLLYVGRLHLHQKRLDVLFDALVKLDKEKWSLVCIGSGPDEERIKQLAREKEIYQNIDWVGWKEEPWESVQDATALVLSSDYEGFGLVLVEALSRGIPVISTNCSGPPDIIKHGENGWLFPIGDSKALSSILEDIISGKKALPSPLICRSSVEKFDQTEVIENIEKILYYYYNIESTKQNPNDISKYIVKDQHIFKTNIVDQLIKTVVNGISYLGTTNEKVDKSNLNQYFTSDFLEQVSFDQGQDEQVNATVCYPKVNMIDYKLTKAIVQFLLVNEGKEQGINFIDKHNCEVKLVNDEGVWRINTLTIIQEEIYKNNNNFPINKKEKKEKTKILLVYTNNSGSNTIALSKNIPERIKSKFEIELAEQSITNNFLDKVKEADILVITEGNVIQDKKYYNPEQKIIDLWHGFPIKSMGYFDKNEVGKNLLSDRWSNIDYIISYSVSFNNMMENCFNIDPTRFHIAGAPRNDLLIQASKNGKREIFQSIMSVNIDNESKVIFYMPTYRQVAFNNRTDSNINRENIFGLESFEDNLFNEFLEINNLHIIVKLHPAEESLFINSYKENKNIHLLTGEMLKSKNVDLYELLGLSDILITDYSSVYFDYLLINKPIIFMPLDINEYANNRGFLIGSYEDWTPGPKVYSQEKLQESILSYLNNEELYEKEREKLTLNIHDFQDGYASERVWEFIASIGRNIVNK